MKQKQAIAGVKRGDRYAATSAGGGERTNLRGYINFKPDQVQKDSFNQWFAVDTNYRAAVVRVLDSGWKITVAADKKPGVFVGTVSTWASGHPSAGIILNTRGTDFVRCLAAVVWALEELYDYDLARHLTTVVGDDELF